MIESRPGFDLRKVGVHFVTSALSTRKLEGLRAGRKGKAEEVIATRDILGALVSLHEASRWKRETEPARKDHNEGAGKQPANRHGLLWRAHEG